MNKINTSNYGLKEFVAVKKENPPYIMGKLPVCLGGAGVAVGSTIGYLRAPAKYTCVEDLISEPQDTFDKSTRNIKTPQNTKLTPNPNMKAIGDPSAKFDPVEVAIEKSILKKANNGYHQDLEELSRATEKIFNTDEKIQNGILIEEALDVFKINEIKSEQIEQTIKETITQRLSNAKKTENQIKKQGQRLAKGDSATVFLDYKSFEMVPKEEAISTGDEGKLRSNIISVDIQKDEKGLIRYDGENEEELNKFFRTITKKTQDKADYLASSKDCSISISPPHNQLKNAKQMEAGLQETLKNAKNLEAKINLETSILQNNSIKNLYIDTKTMLPVSEDNAKAAENRLKANIISIEVQKDEKGNITYDGANKKEMKKHLKDLTYRARAKLKFLKTLSGGNLNPETTVSRETFVKAAKIAIKASLNNHTNNESFEAIQKDLPKLPAKSMGIWGSSLLAASTTLGFIIKEVAKAKKPSAQPV